MTNLANHAANASLSSYLLHLMSTKILRRFRKLGTSVPEWLSDSVMQTCARLSDTLDNRCKQAQIVQRASPLWNPSQLDLTRDIQLPLPHCSEYLSTSLTNHGTNPLNTPVFQPLLRRTLRDFLSSEGMFFKEAYRQNPRVALYDVEQVVKQEIDDWIACVTDVDEACIQLDVLVEKYMLGVKHISGIFVDQPHKPSYDPQHLSVALLTMIELWIALDKLVAKKIPMLAGYSPEIPMDPFDRFLLKTMNLHRFFRAHQYLSARHAQSHPGSSVFSEEFTEHSFPVRCYDSSPHLQHLGCRIEEDLLPTRPLHVKVVLFELQCPVSFEAWRSVTIRLLDFFHCWNLFRDASDCLPKSMPITKIPELRRYGVRHRRAFVSLAYSDPECRDTLIYTIYDGDTPRTLLRHPTLAILTYFAYQIPSGIYADSGLQRYLTTTTHTSNEVLSAQSHCSADLSLHEFIAFGHVRSGGSLQWMNILKEVHGRTLNFRRPEVYLLLAQASAQVGPLANTGELIWHQDLQDVPFCHILLDELENLIVDVAAGSSDGSVMGTIPILASLLASRPSEAISKRTIQLLRNVRGKTFDWVNELLYDAIKSPTNKECRQVLWNMAAICRSTFDVDLAIIHKVLYSAQDIEIALACAFLMRTTVPTNFSSMCDPLSAPDYSIDRNSSDPDTPGYSRVLLERDCRLSHTLEGVLKDAIQADIPDLGIDLAVRKSWPGYRPGTRRWKPLDHPNSHWIACQTGETDDRRSQMVHVNLLDGSLLVDGRPIGERLPSAITEHSVYRVIFGDVRAFATPTGVTQVADHSPQCNLEVIPSDLPGVDFVTLFTISEHYVSRLTSWIKQFR